MAHRRLRRLAVASICGLAEPADRRFERRLDALVAQPRLLVRPDPLDLGLDVRHEGSLEVVRYGWGRPQTSPTRRYPYTKGVRTALSDYQGRRSVPKSGRAGSALIDGDRGQLP